MAADLGRNARGALIASILLTIALYAIPHGHTLAYPLMLLSTVVHELGHGIAAILAGGEFAEFRMWGNGSGVARSAVEPGLAHAFVSAGGLCGPAVAAALFLWLGRRAVWARRCLAAFGAFLVLALLLWVRGQFGMIFVGAVAVTCLSIALLTSAETAQIALVFVATQLALSVYSRGDYLFKQYARTGAGKMPSDVQNMANELGGPYWLWGGLCAAFSAAVLLGAAWLYLAPASRGPRPTAITAPRPSPRSSRRAP